MLLNKIANFRIPQEEYYMYPTWLFLYNQVIVLPIIWLSAMATKILMKKRNEKVSLWQQRSPNTLLNEPGSVSRKKFLYIKDY